MNDDNTSNDLENEFLNKMKLNNFTVPNNQLKETEKINTNQNNNDKNKIIDENGLKRKRKDISECNKNNV